MLYLTLSRLVSYNIKRLRILGHTVYSKLLNENRQDFMDKKYCGNGHWGKNGNENLGEKMKCRDKRRESA